MNHGRYCNGCGKHMWRGWKRVRYEIESGNYTRDHCAECADKVRGHTD